MARVKHLSLLLCAIVLSGCPKTAQHPDPAPVSTPAPRIPQGCERDLSGLYRYEGEPTWEYNVSDDGGTLVAVVQRTTPDGGLAAPESFDGGARVTLNLQRTADGFHGQTRAPHFTPLGRLCDVSFLTRVEACGDGGLTISSAETAAIDEQCQPAPNANAPAKATHRLVGPQTPAP